MLEKKIEEAEASVRNQIRTLAALIKQRPAQEVADYVFRSAKTGEEVRLSELFGKKAELIAVHNMGVACPGCTAWADGFNGLYEHIADRASFVLTSPDIVEVQRKVREKRGWKMPMVSTHDNTFTFDMGFTDPNRPEDPFKPGVSTFRRENGKIIRTAYASFGPGDLYNPVPHLFDLLVDGSEGWFPKVKYEGDCHGGH